MVVGVIMFIMGMGMGPYGNLGVIYLGAGLTGIAPFLILIGVIAQGFLRLENCLIAGSVSPAGTAGGSPGAWSAARSSSGIVDPADLQKRIDESKAALR